MRTNVSAIVILSFWTTLALPSLSADGYFQDDFEGSNLNSFWSLLNPAESLGGMVALSSEQHVLGGVQSLKLSREAGREVSELIVWPDTRSLSGVFHAFEDARPREFQVYLYDNAANAGTPFLILYERPPWSEDPGHWIAVFPGENVLGRFFFVNTENDLADQHHYTWEDPWDGWNEFKVIVHPDYREVQINGDTAYLGNLGFNVAGVALCVLTTGDDYSWDWNSGLEELRPYSWYFDLFSCEPTLLEGIHVSHEQNEANPTQTINWAEVAGAGKTFAYVKASQWDHWPDGDGPEHDFTDINVREARQAGLRVGAYHVAGNPGAIPPVIGDAVVEAEYFCSRASAYIGHPPFQYGYPFDPGYLPPVLRLEADFGLTQKQLSDWARKWVQTVECQTGIRPYIYTVPEVFEKLDPKLWGTPRIVSVTQENWLWIGGDPSMMGTDPACVNSSCIPTWMFNQYSDTGSCPGISGPVPLDRFNGDQRTLNALALVEAEQAEAPSFYGYSFKAMAEQSTQIPVSKLLAYAHDPKSLPMQLSTILRISDEWGDISIDGENISYTPPSGFVGTDQFSLSLRNCQGGTSVATIQVTVVASESESGGNGGNLSSITAGTDGIHLTFYGIPNQSYAMQRSGDLTTWTTITTITATGTGKIAYTDHAPLSAGYYRTSSPP